MNRAVLEQRHQRRYCGKHRRQYRPHHAHRQRELGHRPPVLLDDDPTDVSLPDDVLDRVDHTEAVRAALTPAAAATLRKVVVFPDENMVTGPTGKVRKFLMRQRHLAEMANA